MSLIFRIHHSTVRGTQDDLLLLPKQVANS